MGGCNTLLWILFKPRVCIGSDPKIFYYIKTLYYTCLSGLETLETISYNHLHFATSDQCHPIFFQYSNQKQQKHAHHFWQLSCLRIFDDRFDVPPTSIFQPVIQYDLLTNHKTNRIFMEDVYEIGKNNVTNLDNVQRTKRNCSEKQVSHL